jgi:hypothetical protein
VMPAGIDSSQTVDSPTVTVVVAPVGVPSDATAGSGTAVGAVVVTPSGVPTTDGCATPVVSVGNIAITPAGISSAPTFGAVVAVLGAVTVAPAGVPSGETTGSVTIAQLLAPDGVPPTETFGAGTSTLAAATINPASIEFGARVGDHRVGFGLFITPAGVEPTRVTGTVLVFTVIPWPPHVVTVALGASAVATAAELVGAGDGTTVH